MESLFDPAANDPETLVMRAALASTSAAAIVMLALGRFVPGPRRNALAWTLAAAFGLAAGVGALGVRPSWPPLTVFDRFLVFLATAAVIIEIAGVWIGRWAWLGRIALAAALVPVLLHGSVVISDAAGPGTRQWPPLETAEYFVLFGEAIVAAWFALTHLAERMRSRALPLALAIACGGGGVTVMYSGYLTGGQLGVALGGALLGASLLSLVVPGPQETNGALGIAMVGLTSMLIAGRYFGSLTTMHGLLLFAAPLTCWLAEFIPTKVWVRGLIGVALTAAQVGHVAHQAQQAATPVQAGPQDEADWYK